MTGSRVVIYGRQACHLCDIARPIVAEECLRVDAAWTEIDIDTDPKLRERYSDYVPVVTVDGVTCGYWQVDRDQLRAALAA